MVGWCMFMLVVTGPSVWALPERRSSVTHEDIRDALLSVVHMLQTTTQKLERHEMRERQLGDQLKKALGGLDGKQRSQETLLQGLVTSLTKLDEKMETVNRRIDQQEERQKGSYTIDTVPLQSWMSNVEGMLNKQTPTGGSEISTTSRDHLDRLESLVSSKIDGLTDALGRLEARFESQLRPSSSSLDERTLALQEKWHQNEMMQLEEMKKLSTDILYNSPNTDNFTKDELAKIRYMIEELGGDKLMNVDVKLQDVIQASNQIPALSGDLRELKSAMDFYLTDAKKSQEDVNRGISKVEQVLIQTADNVLDTRRRVEYGVQEVLLGLGEMIKTESKDLNDTVNSRFNDISQTILENQNFGLSNLSSKIEMEISQVWRQIGIMYQQLTESTSALGKLQRQTELYVNGSLNTMDNMDGRVEEITGRVSDVKDNLNYLMGRLLLVTQEFNQTKGDLATAFENLRNTFRSVRQEAKDLGPGPNPIDEGDDNKL